jgi:hypothetical protein
MKHWHIKIKTVGAQPIFTPWCIPLFFLAYVAYDYTLILSVVLKCFVTILNVLPVFCLLLSQYRFWGLLWVMFYVCCVFCQSDMLTILSSDPGKQHQCNSIASVPLLAPTWARTSDSLHTSTTDTHEASLPIAPQKLRPARETTTSGLRARDVIDWNAISAHLAN